MEHTYTLSELCQALGKDYVFVKNLKKTLKLKEPTRDEGYSEAYLKFLEKVVSLRAFNVSLRRITELFEMEKKILKLLHVDSLSDSKTWYLDACDRREHTANPGESIDSLLLTGYDLGFAITSGAVQHNLDFGEKDPELFKGSEMGEDVKRVIEKYLQLLAKIGEIVARERGVLQKALDWARRQLIRKT